LTTFLFEFVYGIKHAIYTQLVIIYGQKGYTKYVIGRVVAEGTRKGEDGGSIPNNFSTSVKIGSQTVTIAVYTIGDLFCNIPRVAPPLAVIDAAHQSSRCRRPSPRRCPEAEAPRAFSHARKSLLCSVFPRRTNVEEIYFACYPFPSIVNNNLAPALICFKEIIFTKLIIVLLSFVIIQ
jgi:hypothetical protein